jgi:ribonuclease D
MSRFHEQPPGPHHTSRVRQPSVAVEWCAANHSGCPDILRFVEPRPVTTFRYVDDPGALAELVTGLGAETRIALDTEFLRERTYFPVLCLVQIASPSGVALVDPLAIEDLTPLAALLADPRVTKVLHAGRQDIEILLTRMGVVPRPVFDTQLAAALLGHGAQVSYAALVESVLGTRLAKAHTRTDWTRRPLHPAQQQYAADDVCYLLELETRLSDALAARGRSDWAQAELAGLGDESLYRSNPEDAWRRIKALHRLDARARRVARALAGWRERQAVRDDRPRQWVLRDNVLLDIARIAPRNAAAFDAVPDMPAAIIRRHGAALAEVVATALADPNPAVDDAEAPERLDAGQKAMLAALTEELRACAERHGLSAELIATRAELEKLVRGERSLALLSGWRGDIAGTRLLEILDASP